ncbi:cell division protein SepF [Staphylococcus simiae]|uniref:Cell division protein SepF n=1 Tax=Staphylococcus simiae CCM 7213 = CCUG 51256 TaxID=911238 RepID=G5JL88_9STAP|nr:cell division protein SepF [Staphylococcus simiae]EHJ07059.1 cell division protein sepF [Staphylococcus simiae CCM 7213 = CCUG 51256]PNZ11944.1 cell division protein SepF [Staphylococcus simiae]SNV68830.1 cell division-like FtsZ-interacting protein [Staphylococcus simiae]
MSPLALKDLFSGFFVIDDEEEVEVPERNDKVREQEPVKEQSQAVNEPTTQNSIKSVPQKTTPRYTTTSEERNSRMTNNSKNNNRNVVTMNNATPNYSAQESSKMCLFEPRVFSDTQDIADELKNRRATLVNLQRIDKVSAKRIIDFLSGTVYAIGGDIQRVGTDIFLCTPDNVEVAGSITDHIENMEQSFD